MRPDHEVLRTPPGDRPELIPADPDARRSRIVDVQLVSFARRRRRIKKVDTYARERLEMAAREIHGNVDVTPRLASNWRIGDVIVREDRPYAVAAVCSCTPQGWSRLDPVRVAADSNQPLPPPIYAYPRCRHGEVHRKTPEDTKPAPIRPTVGATYGDEAWVESYDRALSLREQYVAQMLDRAAAAEGRPEAAVILRVAMRADAMTDDEWLEERKRRNR